MPQVPSSVVHSSKTLHALYTAGRALPAPLLSPKHLTLHNDAAFPSEQTKLDAPAKPSPIFFKILIVASKYEALSSNPSTTKKKVDI
jgi:hypothetical protein